MQPHTPRPTSPPTYAWEPPPSAVSRHMRQALALGWDALGSTSPNPAVGCVIARDGAVVGVGKTHPPGGMHAEAAALADAGDSARGATIYTTLEPCNHHGRTPPCADAIIAAGIATAHIAALDPNPNVIGGGAAKLQAAGIGVHIGDGAAAGQRLIEGFAKHSATGMPFVTAKFAMSLDGKIAARGGDSKWISGAESRMFAHTLRAQSDAVIVGINTALADDPQLTARDAQGSALARQPLRVVLDSRARLLANARMLSAPGKTLIATAGAADRRIPDGADALSLPSADGGVDLRALMAALGERDIVNALVEGGGGVLGALFDLNLVDKVVAFVAPVIIGGRNAVSPVAGEGAAQMTDALRLRDVQMRRFGEDVAIIGYCGGDNNDVHGNC